MQNRIISLGILFFIGTTSILFFITALAIWAFTVLLDRRLIILHRFTSFWASLYLWIVPAWSISIKGRDKIKKHTTYIVVSNHQSQLDILSAFKLFFHFKWVSKAEIFKVPLIGWNMVLNRYIKLQRGVSDSAKKMMLQCEKTLAQGSSVYFFPEGTRSKTGILKPFKIGAFILAHKTRIPILPIVINGTKNALPKHSMNFHGQHAISVEVLDEIPYKCYSHFSVKETADFIRHKIIEHVDEHKGRRK
ncbi:MAG: 1-acyl-sn-glycerol-3-phosphate acyltransferase [Deltaproteobacteria bacterium]|nr:1-acyl-sn-glycerol-3-phosphate acyltransferase [Deltaproteobacteria bacterium]